MNLLLLAGNSNRNRAWIHGTEQGLASSFKQTFVQDYEHWQSGEDIIDLDLELNKASSLIPNDEQYLIFAKSAGSIIAIQGISEGRLTPKACLFVGLPLRFIEKLYLPVNEWLRGIHIPIIIMQNDNDPVGSFDEVSNYLRGLSENITILISSGETHDYDDVTQINELLKSLTDS